MTKREICERLLEVWAMEPYKRGEAVRHLILDIAAPEKEEKKEPLVLIYEEKGKKVPCPVCGAPAAPIKNKHGAFLCKRCGGLVCAEDGK